MAKITFGVGIILIAVGAFFFLTAEVAEGAKRPVTSLIPAFIGLPVALLGCIGCCKPAMNKHAAHVAVVLTLLGTLGGIGMGFKNMGTAGKETAVTAQFIMGAVCLVHVILSVKSFIAAKKAPEAAAAAGE